ncbi:hypothetical protein [Zobellia uliginosa]|uniref:hypothetical protein n=1 Tax=Zobellia uliginosa TaxID=143224 RepID=UPI001C0799E5|nr:hypothetical protein [Zobellia uliginosa]MBU2945679.1 hypothetical protein [Zobellia uliginosa]
MQQKKQHNRNSIKPGLIKYLALIIAVCYIFNPLHQQLNTLFHEVSHVLEMPDTVVGHSSIFEKNKVHTAHEHLSLNTAHEHKFIKIIDAIFNNSDTDNSSQDKVLTDFKFDKHLTTTYANVSFVVYDVLSQNFKSVKNSLILGYISILEEPPRKDNSPISVKG